MSDRDGRTYWRSPEELSAGPETGGRPRDEFPEGASNSPGAVSRREMLQLLGVTASLAGLTACRRPVEKILPYTEAPENIVPGIPQHYATTMPLGHSAYGLVVESHEGRPTKIEGNELHPASLGGSSLWMQAAIYDLYDPDRSRSVLHAGAPAEWKDFVAAWKDRSAAHEKEQGAGLAVLTEPFSSPTLARLGLAFRERFPRARWAAWEPASDENQRLGLERALGAGYQPVYHVERARVLLVLDSDFLASDPEHVRHARAFADGRRLASDGDEMNRLYVVESDLSPTGIVADHRLRLRSRLVGAFTAALAGALARLGLPLGPVAAGASATAEQIGCDPRFLEALARDLLAHRGLGLVVAGVHQPPEVHAAVAALNDALGNAGTTVTYHELRDASAARTADLSGLVSALTAGEVRTLVILGGNPAYNAPADLGLAEAMKKAAQTIHLSFHVNETSKLATWHLPMAHFLEAWGDARGVGGTLSVVQPLIEPLFGGHSAAELLGLLTTGEQAKGHDLMRETWRGILGAADFEARWRRVLHDGLLAGSELPAAAPPCRREVLAELVRLHGTPVTADASALEVVFRLSRSVHDGRFANVAWLQEVPEPVTKLVWDNAVLLSHATAAALGVTAGEVVRLGLRDRTLEAPVFVLPTMADWTATLPLGYGRRAAGRVGNGVGFDAYALRTTGALWMDAGLRVEKTGRRHPLVTTQEHWRMDGRPIVLEATLEKYREHPEFAKHAVEHPPLRSIYPDHDYSRGYQWGMVVDLDACVGCNACVVACQSENNIPVVGKDQVRRGRDMHWIRVDRYFSGDPDRPDEARGVFQPVMCQHCENAPCEEVCPVAATLHDAEGLNVMVYNRCIGTRYCSNNCPYKVRRFNFYNFTRDTPELLKIAQNPDVTVRSRGVMEKCTYCVQRIREAEIGAKQDGRLVRDGDLKTACQQACPARAIEFGNINDGESAVSRLKGGSRNYALLEELNNRPRTTYLARIRNANPEIEKA